MSPRPSGASIAPGNSEPLWAGGETIGRDKPSKLPTGPETFSSRYPCGVDELPTCHWNMISVPPPTQAGLSGDPDTDGPFQILLAPGARGSTSMASWLPSGDSAAVSESMNGTWIGRRDSRAERPPGATRSRKKPRSSVMAKVRPLAEAVMPDGMGGVAPNFDTFCPTGTFTVVSNAPVAESRTAAVRTARWLTMAPVRVT